eukprot:CAMPEP_0170195172 /NCGR_PEP_ID=MMETSP0040_2-20121228/60939_1 /TAXON_ID=641309 /ORGANISM="Lotharella oceanica, Strain CCMP622" /LENGTH=304 /DNA_ID=CAMNT_0010444275 /DNA_START=165 /DNA_END=1079 /DNA_ORIENTATION=+
MGIKASSTKRKNKSGKKEVKEELQIMVMGYSQAGKESCVYRLVADEYRGEGYSPCSRLDEDNYRKMFQVDGERDILDIYLFKENTKDQLGNASWLIRQCEDKYCHFLLLYSIIDRKTFRYLPFLRAAILKRLKVTEIPMTLVGCKKDLESKRKVQYEEGLALASVWKCPYFEISSKTGHGVSSPFEHAVRLWRNPANPWTSADGENPSRLLARRKDIFRALRRDAPGLAMMHGSVRDALCGSLLGATVMRLDERSRAVGTAAGDPDGVIDDEDAVAEMLVGVGPRERGKAEDSCEFAPPFRNCS